MNKETALSIVAHVKSRRQTDDIPELMDTILSYIQAQEPFDYQKTMQFISEQAPGKMGGKYIYQSKALKFLRNEMKSAYKKVTHIITK